MVRRRAQRAPSAVALLPRAPRAALLLLACATAFHAPRRAPRRAVALRSEKSERRWPFAFPNASDAAEGARDALASTRNAFDEVRARGDRVEGREALPELLLGAAAGSARTAWNKKYLLDARRGKERTPRRASRKQL